MDFNENVLKNHKNIQLVVFIHLSFLISLIINSPITNVNKNRVIFGNF